VQPLLRLSRVSIIPPVIPKPGSVQHKNNTNVG